MIDAKANINGHQGESNTMLKPKPQTPKTAEQIEADKTFAKCLKLGGKMWAPAGQTCTRIYLDMAPGAYYDVAKDTVVVCEGQDAAAIIKAIEAVEI
jgi:hypothetical protein